MPPLLTLIGKGLLFFFFFFLLQWMTQLEVLLNYQWQNAVGAFLSLRNPSRVSQGRMMRSQVGLCQFSRWLPHQLLLKLIKILQQVMMKLVKFVGLASILCIHLFPKSWDVCTRQDQCPGSTGLEHQWDKDQVWPSKAAIVTRIHQQRGVLDSSCSAMPTSWS